jgi:hypothetical protein
MEGVFVEFRAVGKIAGMALVALVVLTAHAAAPVPRPEQEPPETAAGAPTPTTKRVPAKIRQGSVLHRNETPLQHPDLRSSFEKRRDAIVALHVTREARLDAIALIGNQLNDTALLEEIDNVRRKELERYSDAMRKLRQEFATAPVPVSR